MESILSRDFCRMPYVAFPPWTGFSGSSRPGREAGDVSANQISITSGGFAGWRSLRARLSGSAA